ncbi:MAG: hypothetical protein D8H97_17940 [Neisseria sp.]|nr:MAG: hypothetical protein D8H97_17940 [Neisseria sp.]
MPLKYRRGLLALLPVLSVEMP